MTDITTPIVPTVMIRYYPDGGPDGLSIWRYQWWDHTVDFVGGQVATHEATYPTMGAVLPALLADTGRTLRPGADNAPGSPS